MGREDRRPAALDVLVAHSADAVVAVAATGWLVYTLSITRGFYMRADDLRVISQSSSWNRVLKPYNGALSLVSMLVDRACAQFGHLSFTPLMIAGLVSLVSVPISYFLTTRRQLGPVLAAALTMPLLWFNGTDLRPANLNHCLALVGGIVAAWSLNRSRKADVVLAVAVAISLCSAGGGVVVAGACVLHNAMTRPPLRRWIAVLVPTALYGLWYVSYSPTTTAQNQLSASKALAVVRALFFDPFRQVGFGSWVVGATLLCFFFVWGALQLRKGLVAGANFVAWTAAMIGWAVALVHSRAQLVDPATFRYAYLSLGFALLAVVPREPVRYRLATPALDVRWVLIAATSAVLVFAGARVLYARRSLQATAASSNEAGKLAKGAMLVFQLGPRVVPDDAPVPFYGRTNPHGNAGDVRALIARYGSPFTTGGDTIDEHLRRVGAIASRIGGHRPSPGCSPLTKSVRVAPTSFGEALLGDPAPAERDFLTGPAQYQLWSPSSYTVDVRRFGDHWVRILTVPARRRAFLVLPALNSDRPWQIRANGACLETH